MPNFSRTQRLITKIEFKNVFDQPYKVSQRYFLALFKPNTRSFARLGLVVNKRTAQSAVTRNKFKRVTRESFRLHQDKVKGLDIIIIAKQKWDTLTQATLREGIDKLWENLKVTYKNG